MNIMKNFKEKWNQTSVPVKKPGYKAIPMVMSRFKAQFVGTLILPVAIIVYLLGLLRVPQALVNQRITDFMLFAQRIAVRCTLWFASPNSKLTVILVMAGTFIIALSIVLAGVMLLMVIHEWCHALGWTIGTEYKASKCKIDLLHPSCHHAEDMTLPRSLCGTLFPAVVTGFVPVILAMVFVSPVLLIIGCLGIIGAGMDIIHAAMMLKYIKFKNVICADDAELIGGTLYIPLDQAYCLKQKRVRA